MRLSMAERGGRDPYLGRRRRNVRDLAERLETVKNDLCEMRARETEFEGQPLKGHDSITVYPRSEWPVQAEAFTDRQIAS
jgi:hypothetical protein